MEQYWFAIQKELGTLVSKGVTHYQLEASVLMLATGVAGM